MSQSAPASGGDAAMRMSKSGVPTLRTAPPAARTIACPAAVSHSASPHPTKASHSPCAHARKSQRRNRRSAHRERAGRPPE